MAPIRVGIIGLTATPTSWAPRAHLAYLVKSPHYTIHGICNSSLESTKAAISAHNLPGSTKAYDSPKSLAADPDIDLVVVVTRVDSHYNIAKPGLLAGKNTFVEWPLAANLEQATELLQLARDKRLKTAVGLQARMSPNIRKIREVVNSERLGKVHSVSVLTSTAMVDDVATEKYAYWADKNTGGNMVTINSMHLLDVIFYVHGELRPSWTPVLANTVPYVNIQKKDGSSERIRKTSPDQFVVAGKFENGAVFSYHMRRGKLFPGVVGLTWRVYAEKGQLDIECEGPAIQLGLPVTVRYLPSGSETAETVLKDNELDTPEWSELPMPGRNIGRIYEAYALGEEEEYGHWELAVKRHEFVEKVFKEGGM